MYQVDLYRPADGMFPHQHRQEEVDRATDDLTSYDMTSYDMTSYEPNDQDPLLASSVLSETDQYLI